jgi:hypothetical protein
MAELIGLKAKSDAEFHPEKPRCSKCDQYLMTVETDRGIRYDHLCSKDKTVDNLIEAMKLLRYADKFVMNHAVDKVHPDLAQSYKQDIHIKFLNLEIQVNKNDATGS